jgi:hypothetical protein
MAAQLDFERRLRERSADLKSEISIEFMTSLQQEREQYEKLIEGKYKNEKDMIENTFKMKETQVQIDFDKKLRAARTELEAKFKADTANIREIEAEKKGSEGKDFLKGQKWTGKVGDMQKTSRRSDSFG